jgi:hypothetical protein
VFVLRFSAAADLVHQHFYLLVSTCFWVLQSYFCLSESDTCPVLKGQSLKVGRRSSSPHQHFYLLVSARFWVLQSYFCLSVLPHSQPMPHLNLTLFFVSTASLPWRVIVSRRKAYYRCRCQLQLGLEKKSCVESRERCLQKGCSKAIVPKISRVARATHSSVSAPIKLARDPFEAWIMVQWTMYKSFSEACIASSREGGTGARTCGRFHQKALASRKSPILNFLIIVCPWTVLIHRWPRSASRRTEQTWHFFYTTFLCQTRTWCYLKCHFHWMSFASHIKEVPLKKNISEKLAGLRPGSNRSKKSTSMLQVFL